MFKSLRTHFISGLLVLAPLFLTAIFFGTLVRLTDKFIVDPIFGLLPITGEHPFRTFFTKAFIALLVVFFLVLVGVLAEKFFMRRALSAWEGLLKNIPLLNVVYGSVKEIAQAFVGDKKGVFKAVVFFEYPRKGLYAMGFVMLDKKWELHERTGRDILNVFVPSPPNPATGFHVFVPREELIFSRMTIEEGLRLVLSAGSVVPPVKQESGE